MKSLFLAGFLSVPEFDDKAASFFGKIIVIVPSDAHGRTWTTT